MGSGKTKLLLALVQAPDHVCYRYRMAAFARRWPSAAGGWSRWCWDAGWAPPCTSGADCGSRRRGAAAALLPWWHLRLVRTAARVLVFDFDDAVYSRDSASEKPSESWPATAVFARGRLCRRHYRRQRSPRSRGRCRGGARQSPLPPHLHPGGLVHLGRASAAGPAVPPGVDRPSGESAFALCRRPLPGRGLPPHPWPYAAGNQQ